MPVKICLTFLLFKLLAVNLTAQIKPDTWAAIEKDISNKNALGQLQIRLNYLLQNDTIKNNPALLARVYHYRIQIGDLQSEDTSYLKQSASLDSILNSSAPTPLKAIAHLMQAQRLSLFTSKFYARNNKNLFSNPGGPAYNNMNRQLLDSLINDHFKRAEDVVDQLKNIPVTDLLWLSSDPYIFLFKPGFRDIINAEQLQWLQQSVYNTGQLTSKQDWLQLSPDNFFYSIDTATSFSKNTNNILRHYLKWANYHGKRNPEAYYFIETLVRKYLYTQLPATPVSEKQYEKYLESLLHSRYTAVKAHVIYQLCLLWNKQAGNYHRRDYPSGNGYYYSNNNNNVSFDSSFRLHYRKAVSLYEANKALLDSFNFLSNILLVMKEKIVSPELQMLTENTYLPDEPMAWSLSFSNVQMLYVRIVRVCAEGEATSIINNDQNRFLVSLPPVFDTVYALPDSGDFQSRQCFLKMHGLIPGRYMAIYSDAAIDTSNNHLAFAAMTVTNIAVINNDEKVFVLQRKTGFPLTGASVVVTYKKTVWHEGKHFDSSLSSGVRMVNANGYVPVKEESVTDILVTDGTDSLYTPIAAVNSELPDGLYDHDEYDDLMEYYEENTKLHLFTDRAIYRPGQKVFYKGIFIIKNPKTGEPLVLNWKNLKFPFFKKLLYKIAVKRGKQKIPVYVQDAFGRNVDTLNVLPNQFGSIAGSFTISQTAATGDWEFNTDDIDIANDNNGAFKVEEYKRPSFEISIEKPKTELQLGDSFHVKIKLRSFAGASLNNVLIKYSIERSGYVPVKNKDSDEINAIYLNKELEDDTNAGWGKSYTNEKGELDIPVNDSLLKQYYFTNEKLWNAKYRIEAEAIDGTGESQEIFTNVELTNRPVKIDFNVSKTIERNQLNPIYISAKSVFAGPVKKPVTVRIYRLTNVPAVNDAISWPPVDTWIYPKAAFEKWFPGTVHHTDTKAEQDTLIYEQHLIAGGDEKFSFPKAILTAGNYRITVVSKDGEKITGETSKNFSVFDIEANALPGLTNSFEYMAYNSVERGKPIKWITGNAERDIFSIYHISYFARGKKGTAIKNEYDIKPEKKGINEWQYTMPEDAVKEIKLTHLYIFNNHLYKQQQTVYLPETANNPAIVIERYRNKMAPGEDGTFSLSIKTKNENTVAELMTTLYDASLDKIEKHEWRMPYLEPVMRIQNNWENHINTTVSSNLYNYSTPSVYKIEDLSKPIWWINTMDHTYGDGIKRNQYSNQGSLGLGISSIGMDNNRMLMGRLPGLSITSTAGLEEVVVVGYGTALKSSMTGSVSSVRIRGVSGITNTKALLILDGVVYDGDMSKIDVSKIADLVVLTDATATALYGSRAANGVILMSTKGPVNVPDIPEEPSLVIRKNFSETAFFLPQVHAGKDGYYTIQFTMPQSVTEWKWKMLAHTKDARFTYSEKSIFTQLPLMVQPNMPRFLYQGDRLILKSRISNIDSSFISGTATLQIEDAITGKDVTGTIAGNTSIPFSIAAKTNTAINFTLQIPAGYLHPLKIKVVAKSTGFADGEEHTLPILSRKILVNQSLPVTLTKKDTGITTPVLPADAAAFGIGLHTTAKPQAAMMNSLPYLANYPYGCAEQTFNKMLAHCVATQMMRTDTAAQNAFHKLPLPAPATPDALPDETAEEIMPWLQLEHAHLMQQQQLRKLLDTLEGNTKIEKYFSQITAMQNADGGVSWFQGGNSDSYMSSYIMGAFGKLMQDKLPLFINGTIKTYYPGFINKLIAYNDQEFIKHNIDIHYPFDAISYLNARSYWLQSNKPIDSVTNVLYKLLDTTLKNINRYSLHQQASIISTCLRFGGTFLQPARQQLENIRQLAISDSVNGIRWKDISNSEDLDTGTEEAIVSIAEAFEQNGTDIETAAGILKWLLTSRQSHYWSNTKSTAAVVLLLQRQHPQILNTSTELSLQFNNRQITTTNDLLNGKLSDFLPADSFPSTVQLQSGNAAVPASGGLHYYYFTAHPPVEINANKTKISKQLYLFDKATNNWQVLNEKMVLKIADKIKTVITITAPKQLQYVFIDDKRAAAFEPADATSGYKYGTGFSYYKSIRDAGFQFFAEKSRLVSQPLLIKLWWLKKEYLIMELLRCSACIGRK